MIMTVVTLLTVLALLAVGLIASFDIVRLPLRRWRTILKHVMIVGYALGVIGVFAQLAREGRLPHIFTLTITWVGILVCSHGIRKKKLKA